MKTVIFATAMTLVSFNALADSEHICQGNSCNEGSQGGQGGQGGSGGIGVGVGVGIGVGVAHARALAGASATSQTEVTTIGINSASAKGGAAVSGGNTLAVIVTDSGRMRYAGSYEVKNVPNPPDVIAHPTAPCRVGFSGSGSGAGFGVGIGGSTLDEGCDAREDARLLYNMGLQAEAVQRLCAKPEMAAALKHCAATPAQAVAPQTQTLY
jgi:hypothetical protein